MLETLNWLTITTPFYLGFSAYSWGKDSGEGHFLPTIVGGLAFFGLVAIWYVLYQFIEYPFWMSWFN